MIPEHIPLFPFPHIINGRKYDGSVISWPDSCRQCKDNRCEKDSLNKISLCPNGYNYVKISPDLVICGIILGDSPSNNRARGKNIRDERKTIINQDMLQNAIRAVRNLDESVTDAIEKKKLEIMGEYIQGQVFKKEFLDPLREDIKKALSFVHDYKQINAQINQNMNVIIEERYKGNNIEDKLEQASREEKAIYYASKLLDEKLNIVKFLMQPEWIENKDACRTFRFHGLVLKYRRIYNPIIEEKDLDVSWQGESTASIIANPQAVAVIPHTFIDNSIKYSPRNGKIAIYLQDIEGGIEFSVSSFGPRIKEDEEAKIFYPFYRGEAAQKASEEGAGFGLYVSQLVAKQHLGSEIKVTQEGKNQPNKGHWTTFNVILPTRAKILEL